MAQPATAKPVSAILAHQDELAAKALSVTGDVNEAGLLVGKVISRAFDRFQRDTDEEILAAALRREMEMLIAARRAS